MRHLDSGLYSRVYDLRMTNPSVNTLKIGAVAKAADVSIDTVRFYESRGLLPEPARTAAGYRLYDLSTVERLSFIGRAKDLGFTLNEIVLLLELQDKGGAKADVRAITNAKLEQIDRKIQDLQRMRKVLGQLNSDCSGEGTVDGCPIIEALAEGDHCCD